MTCIPPTELGQVEGLTAEDDVAQRKSACLGGCDSVGLGELVERRRCLVEHRDLFGDQQFAELLRRASRVVVDDDELAAVQQRSPQLPHREVERVRVEHCPHVGVVEAELVDRVLEQRRDRRVRDLNTLGASGASGRVDDVGDRVRGRFAEAILVAEHVGRQPLQCGRGLRVVDEHRGDAVGRHRSDVRRRGDDAHRAGVVEHERQPVRRIGDVDREVAAARLQYCEQHHDEVGGARHRHRDECLGSDADGDQMSRKPIRACVQVCVRVGRRAVDDGDGVGETGCSRFESAGERVLGRRATRMVPRGLHRRDFGGADDVDVTDDAVRVGGDGLDDGGEPVREHAYRRLVEQIGGVRDRRRHACGSTGFVDVLRHRQLQIELRDGSVEVERGDDEFGQFEVRPFVVLELDQYLEQRRAIRRAQRCQFVDQSLERYVGIVERGEIGGTRPCEQVGEAHVR
ncbi:hypothetical protein RhoFasB10_03715 [Rhodococcus sp. B10]|nr:hypothetical protein [Rhodococcus sp. B10]